MNTPMQAEPLVAQRNEEGFSVYAPSDPRHYHLVRGTRHMPTCSCPDFDQNVRIDPNYICRHIETVLKQLPNENGVDPEARV